MQLLAGWVRVSVLEAVALASERAVGLEQGPGPGPVLQEVWVLLRRVGQTSHPMDLGRVAAQELVPVPVLAQAWAAQAVQ